MADLCDISVPCSQTSPLLPLGLRYRYCSLGCRSGDLLACLPTNILLSAHMHGPVFYLSHFLWIQKGETFWFKRGKLRCRWAKYTHRQLQTFDLYYWKLHGFIHFCRIRMKLTALQTFFQNFRNLLQTAMRHIFWMFMYSEVPKELWWKKSVWTYVRFVTCKCGTGTLTEEYPLLEIGTFGNLELAMESGHAFEMNELHHQSLYWASKADTNSLEQSTAEPMWLAWLSTSLLSCFANWKEPSVLGASYPILQRSDRR